MKEQLSKVAEFHKAFKDEDGVEPRLLEEKTFMLRHNIMTEEVDEYLDACWKSDIIEIADALGDQLYILCGTILKHGLQHKIEEVFAEIHRSNMSKLGPDGFPIFREDMKIMKGPNYTRPDLKPIIEK